MNSEEDLLIIMQTFYFVHAVDSQNVTYYLFQLTVGVNFEAYPANHDSAVGLGIESLHRQVQSVSDAVSQVDEKMMAVHSPHREGDRVEGVVGLEINGNHIVAVR